MSTSELLEQALKLKPDERFLLVDSLIKSLDEPDTRLDEIWIQEAEARLQSHREGKLDGIPMEEIFSSLR